VFENPKFNNYDFDLVPLNRDIFLMDVVWMQEYEKVWLRFFDSHEQFNPVGMAIAYPPIQLPFGVIR
jgi:hypothetical protein